MSKKHAMESRAWESAWRSLFEWSSDAVVLTDRNGGIVDANRSAVQLLGYSSSEHLVSTGSIENHFKERSDLSRLRKTVLHKGGARECEARLLRGCGQTFDALVTGASLGGGDRGSEGYLVIIRDISRQKRDQEQIDRQHAHLAILHGVSVALSSSLDFDEVLQRTMDTILELVEAASVRIYILDHEKQSLHLVAWKGLSESFINKEPFRCRKLGDGLLGKTVITRETTVVDNYLRAEDPYVDSVIEEGLKSSVYIPLVSKERAVGVLCVTSQLEYRFPPEFVALLTAVGNQIGVAIENANLYENLKGAYQEIIQAQEQVIRSEKLASLGKLAATIAHEINNPLSVVLTYVKLMRKLVSRETFNADRITDISRYLKTMESETARCGEIVKNLLAFARQSELHMGDHHIEEVIDPTLSLIGHDLDIKEIHLVREIEPHLPRVRCDFRRIQQALLNLLINASESMSKGGFLTVTGRRASKDGFVAIAVSDTGCGIPDKDLRNIFEPFFTTKGEAKGVGLGLAVVYGIVARHGGSVEVHSEVGKGSTFEVVLPMAQE
jgi:PAS domain S-box-containing protein